MWLNNMICHLQKQPKWFRKTLTILFPLWFILCLIEFVCLIPIALILLLVMGIFGLYKYLYLVGWKGDYHEFRCQMYGCSYSLDKDGNIINKRCMKDW